MLKGMFMEVFKDYAYYYNTFNKDKDYKKEAKQIDDLIKRYGMKLLINDLEKAKRSFESAYAEDYKK